MALTIPAVFMQTEPLLVAKQTLNVLSLPALEPGRTSTSTDNFAAAELAAAKHILAQAVSLGSVGSDEFATYLDQVNVHLERAKHWGFRTVITVPIPNNVQEELDAAALSLSLLTIYAEICLAATSWVAVDRALTLQYLASGHVKALAVAQVCPAKVVRVDEELDLLISAHLGRRKVVHFEGYRPEPGSAGYLAQEIQLAQVVAEGHRLSAEDISNVYSEEIESYQLLLGTCRMGAWQDAFTSELT